MGHKIAINTEYGGFSLSDKAERWMGEHGVEFSHYDTPRHDPTLIECIETLGKEANGDYAELAIVEIEGNKYVLREYDGIEWVETPDTIDWIVIDEDRDNIS